jgi:endonuclease YncB( thermonuclease family)
MSAFRRQSAAVCLPAMILVAAAAAPVTAQTPQQAAPTEPHRTVSGTAVAMTGDLITVGGASVRLYGIAAPVPGETCETRYGKTYDCYRHATDILQALIGDTPVTCTITTSDRNGQQIGVCRAGGIDLASAMVSHGWAYAYRRLTPAYAGAEAFAESHRLGMWAGKVETPWQWRSRQLSDTAR